MALENKPLKTIVETDLQELIYNEVREGKMIEYKRDIIGSTTENKKEFCKDVSSFANDSGGYLIIGIEAEYGIPININYTT
jgi:predicted HTH transcriptional regulator